MKNANTRKLFFCAAISLAAAVSQVQAQSWVGGVGGAWEVAGNWSTTAVPVGGGFAVFSGTESAVVGIGVNAEMWRMNIQGSNIGGGTTSAVTINTGGTLTTGVTGPGQSSAAGINMNWGGSGGDSGSIINVTGGTLVSQLIRTSGSAVGQDATLNVTAGGTATITTLDFDQTGGANRTLLVDGIGSSLTVNGDLDMDGGFGTATLSNGADLRVEGAMTYDSLLNSAFTVGSGSTLELGNDTHTFTDGLTIVTGATLGTSGNAATPATAIGDGQLILGSGITLDYSINGEQGISDEWTIGAAADLQLTAGSIDLIVDVVAGDVKQSAGPWTIFDWSVPANGPSLGEFNSVTWNITAADGTRLSTAGSVEYIDNGVLGGAIVLDGFEAFSIPEPSTAMLLGMGALVMILRRRALR